MDTVTQENVVLSQTQPTVLEQQSNLPQPKQSNFLTILLSVLLLLSFSIAGFFAYQTQMLVKELTNLRNEPISTASAEPVTTVDPTANWRTYSDLKFHYSFKFSDIWVDQTSINDKNLGNFTLKSNEGEWITGTVFTGIPDLENDKKNGGSSHSFVLDSQKYLFVVYSECMGPGCGVSKKHLDTFNQILSTFKFVGSNSITVVNDKSEIEIAAKKAFVERIGQEPTTKYGLSDESLKVVDNWAFGVITTAPLGEGSGPGANYFIARKINNIWEAKMEYTNEFKDWLKLSPAELVDADLKKVLQ